MPLRLLQWLYRLLMPTTWSRPGNLVRFKRECLRVKHCLYEGLSISRKWPEEQSCFGCSAASALDTTARSLVILWVPCPKGQGCTSRKESTSAMRRCLKRLGLQAETTLSG